MTNPYSAQGFVKQYPAVKYADCNECSYVDTCGSKPINGLCEDYKGRKLIAAALPKKAEG